jgi:chromosome segregation ATPase
VNRAALVLAPFLVVGLVLGCGPDRAAELRQEIAKLEQDRVPLDALEKATHEADAAEADAAARVREADEARAELAKLEAEAKRTAEAFARQVATNEALRAKIDDTTQHIAAARAQEADLAARVAREQEQAGYLRDQAQTLAQQVRPDDPDWANARRIENPEVGSAVAAAESLRDRLGWVYGLEAAPVASEPPAAPGAGGAAQGGEAPTE